MTDPTPGYELATVLSVATRIEPELIRAMRLTLRPRLDVGAEADLWFGDLVSVRGPDAIMLDPERLPELRARLAALDEPDLLPRIWQVLERIHGETLSPALFLEERVTWLAVANRLADASAALLPAIRALTEEGRTGILDWFADAWPRLPSAVHETTPAWQLATVASSHLPSVAPAPRPRPDPLTPDDIATIAALLPDIPLALRRDGGQLVLGDLAEGFAILVPDTEPRVVEIQSGDGWQPVLIPAGQQISVPVGRGAVRLRTARGLVFEAPAPAEPPGPQRVREAAQRASDRKAPPDTGFTQRYLAHVADEFATFELFQLEPGPTEPRSFADFYSPPTISRRNPDQRGEVTVAGVEGPAAIAADRRVLLFGGPGSGKTTFLRWLTHSAATETDTDDWPSAVPFFLPLRHFAERDLPQPEELVASTAPDLAGEQPDGWAFELLASGRALLLLDGLDELPLWRRDYVAGWLSQMVGAYPSMRCVVSLRPGISTAEWQDDDNFVLHDLLPLSQSDQRELVGQWFAAARAAQGASGGDSLERAEQSLLRDLSTRPDLRQLAADPLLCSVLCALYRDSWFSLPRNRMNLLSTALQLLLGPWDSRKRLRVDELGLSLGQKRILLERFAGPMVRNEEIQISTELAELRLARALSGLQADSAEPAAVLRHLLVRTGLLRAAGDGIQFAQRIFRDFLAAGELVKVGELSYLIDHADEGSLTEVFFMAVAQARVREVDQLLRGVLARARRDGTERGVADRLVLLAAASLDYADTVSGEVRVEVLAAMRRLIPPTTTWDAELLARAGSFVAELLPGPADVDRHAGAMVIRTLVLIGSEEALGRIREFSTTAQPFVGELLEAWRMVGYSEQFARTVLSNVDFGSRVVEAHTWDVLRHLPHLPTLTALRVIGDVPLADSATGQNPLAELPRLRQLTINNNMAIPDLSGLAGCRALRSLRVIGSSGLRDLSALASLNVEELELVVTQLERPFALDTLAGASVRELSLRHPSLRDGLGAIPADLPLRELNLRNVRRGELSLRGISRWPSLEILKITDVPTEDELRELAFHPSLRRLELIAASDLDAVRAALPRVQVFSANEGAARSGMIGAAGGRVGDLERSELTEGHWGGGEGE